MSSYFIFKNNLFANNKKIYKNENHETLCFIGIGGKKVDSLLIKKAKVLLETI